jgi:hypothetical protein
MRNKAAATAVFRPPSERPSPQTTVGNLYTCAMRFNLLFSKWLILINVFLMAC